MRRMVVFAVVFLSSAVGLSGAAQAGRGEPTDGKAAFAFDLHRDGDRNALHLVMRIGPGAWQLPDEDVDRWLFPPPVAQDLVTGWVYQSDLRTRGWQTSAFLLLQDLRLPASVGADAEEAAGPSPTAAEPAPNGEPSERAHLVAYLEAWQAAMQKAGRTLHVPFDQLRSPRVLKAGSVRAPVWTVRLAFSGASAADLSAGKGTWEGYRLEAFRVRDWLVLLLAFLTPEGSREDQFFNGVSLVPGPVAAKEFRNVKFKSLAPGDAPDHVLSFVVPEGYERSYPHGAVSPPSALRQDDLTAAWIRRDDGGREVGAILVHTQAATLGFARDWPGWRTLHEGAYAVAAEGDRQNLAKGVDAWLHAGAALGRPQGWTCQFLALGVGGTLHVISVEIQGEDDEAKKACRADMHALLSTLGVAVTR